MVSRKGNLFSDRNLLIVAVIGLVVVATGAVDLGGFLGAVSGQPDGELNGGGCGFVDPGTISPDNCGESGTVSVAAEDRALTDNARAATPVHVLQEVEGGTNTLLGPTTTGANSRADFTLNRGNRYTAYGGISNTSFPYVFSQSDVLTVNTDNVNLQGVSGIDSTPSVSIFDEDGNALTDNGSDAFGSGETKTYEKIEMTVNESDAGYNTGMLLVEANNTNIEDVRVGDADWSEATCPASHPDADFCFSYNGVATLHGSGQGVTGDIPQNFEKVTAESLIIDLADNTDPSGATQFTAYFEDSTSYIDNDESDPSDQVKQGVVDEDGADVGQGSTQQFQQGLS